MIVLGRKYNFSDNEISAIKKNFPHYKNIRYTDKTPEEVITILEKEITGEKPNLIVLNTKAQVPDKLIQYLTRLQFEKDIKFLTIENFLEIYLKKCYIPESQKDLTFLTSIKPYTMYEYILKRAIDFCIAIPLGIISLPVMLYAAYRIKKESPDGPVFFRQKRVGKNGVEFECVKFRSMRTNVEYFNHYTQKDDPRIFPWGAFMRKSRIDELPQLINVLKGEMHIIGPRAEWNELVTNYEKQIPYYNERHLVAPGITGWAQVNYSYGKNIEDTLQKLMYDLYYIKNWSLTLEIKTAIKTALVMIGKKGL